MADKDLSKYSNEELMRIAQGASSQSIAREEPGFWSNLGHGVLNFGSGAARGIGQGIGDLGASVLNAPIQLTEYLSNRHLPHVPHPHLINEHPESLSESIGQTLGQIGSGFALPGGAAIKGAQLANRGYQALRAGKELPIVGKLMAGGLGGAAEGALGNEENRTLGAEIGSILGGGTQGAKMAINAVRGMKSKNIAKDITDTYKNFEKNFEQRFNPSLEAGEEAGANKFLKTQKGNLTILKKAGGTDKKSGTKDLVYALEQYNANPTLKNAHYAQRDLNKFANIHKYAPQGTAERKAYEESLKLKNRLLQQISEAFEKSGAKEHGEIYSKARTDYATEFGPYLNSKAISDLLGKNPSRTRKIRPSKFADKLLEEEEFLAQAGKNHPQLLRREKYNMLKENPFARGALIGTSALATPFLPYAISKALGLK